jgi:hypothetical protein
MNGTHTWEHGSPPATSAMFLVKLLCTRLSRIDTYKRCLCYLPFRDNASDVWKNSMKISPKCQILGILNLLYTSKWLRLKINWQINPSCQILGRYIWQTNFVMCGQVIEVRHLSWNRLRSAGNRLTTFYVCSISHSQVIFVKCGCLRGILRCLC